jgi:hypothetical protein
MNLILNQVFTYEMKQKVLDQMNIIRQNRYNYNKNVRFKNPFTMDEFNTYLACYFSIQFNKYAF